MTYSPMGILAARYSPAEFVNSTRLKPLLGFETCTLALGTAALVGSTTEPTTVASCAHPRVGMKKAGARKSKPAFTMAHAGDKYRCFFSNRRDLRSISHPPLGFDSPRLDAQTTKAARSW